MVIAEHETWVLDDTELMGEFDGLSAEITRLISRKLGCLREINDRGLGERDGQLSTPSWIAFRGRSSRKTAASDLRLAKKLVLMPHVAAALAEGQITVDHARLFARVHTLRTAESFVEAEAGLVESMMALDFSEAETMLRVWEQYADPDGADQRLAKAVDGRRFSLSQVGDEFVINGLSDPVSGTEIKAAHQRIIDELFKADWEEAKQRLGDSICAADLDRTHAQRSHDALLEMARRATATAPGAKKPEPLVTIVMDYETFIEETLCKTYGTPDDGFGEPGFRPDKICRLLDGTPIPPAAACEIAIRHQISRIVMDGESIILDAGRDTRFFRGGLRRALMIRDRECTWPGCHISSAHCEMDHIVDYDPNGNTSAVNGHPLCHGHHRKKHSNKFHVYKDDKHVTHFEHDDGTPIQPPSPPPPD